MKKILLFGDSNTWGHNPADCSQLKETWGTILRKLRPELEITIDGECGRATKFGEGPKNGIDTFRKRYLKSKPDFDLIVIMLGTNDTLDHLLYEPQETADTIAEYIHETRGLCGNDAPDFLIISPILVRDEAMKHPIFSELYCQKSIEISTRFASALREMAQKEGAYFMNAADYARASSIDGIHMESGEHKKLADAVEKKIKEIYKQ